MKDNTSTHNKPNSDPPTDIENTVVPMLQLEPDKYREYLDEFDMSIEQQNELLETLFNIMRTFVEIGFDLDSVQLFSNDKNGISSPDSVNVLTMKDSKHSFNQAVTNNPAKEESHD
jgi:hypothetical protein